MFSVLCAVDCSYFAFAEIFGLRIFVLSDDLGLTLVLVFPFSGRISVLPFFLEHLVDDPAEMTP